MTRNLLLAAVVSALTAPGAARADGARTLDYWTEAFAAAKEGAPAGTRGDFRRLASTLRDLPTNDVDPEAVECVRSAVRFAELLVKVAKDADGFRGRYGDAEFVAIESMVRTIAGDPNGLGK